MSSSRSWGIWLIGSIFYAYQYLLRVMPNIMINDIIEQFQIDAATFGQFSGVYYVGYSLMHLPIGIMLDRYGIRKIMSISVSLTVIGLLPLLYAHHWIYPIVGRFLIGVGSSAAILSLFKIIRSQFPAEQFPRMLSFSVMIGLVGAIYGGGPLHYMCQSLNYHTVIYLFGIAGLLLSAVVYSIIPGTENRKPNSIRSDVQAVLGERKIILIALFAGLMVGPLEGFADVWGTAFLKQTYQLGSSIAAHLPSIIFIGMCFGAPILSWIAERTKNHLATIFGSGLLMALLFSLMLFYSLTIFALSVSFALIGICSSYQILAIYTASTYASKERAGLATGLVNMIIMTFGYGFHTVIGIIINQTGGLTHSSALKYGIGIIPIGLWVGAIGFLLFSIKKVQNQCLSKKILK